MSLITRFARRCSTQPQVAVRGATATRRAQLLCGRRLSTASTANPKATNPKVNALTAALKAPNHGAASDPVKAKMATPAAAAVQVKAAPAAAKRSPVLTVALSDATRDALSERLLTETRSPYAEYMEMTKKMEGILREVLPADVQELVSDMGRTHEPNALVIKNCPVKKNPGPTAEEDRHVPADGFLEEYTLLGMAGMRHCQPHRSPHKKSGEIFTQIRAIKGAEKKASSQGNGVFFPLHVEEVNRTHGLDFLTLLCKKGDPNAATTVLPVDRILKGLPDWVLEGMQKPDFAMHAGELWTGPKTPMIAPILEKDPRGGFFVRYNAAKDRVQGLTPDAEKIVKYLKEHFDKGLEFEQVFLERGDCLTVSNKKAMHGRTAYTPSRPWDQRRDLVRLYETTDLDQLFKMMYL